MTGVNNPQIKFEEVSERAVYKAEFFDNVENRWELTCFGVREAMQDFVNQSPIQITSESIDPQDIDQQRQRWHDEFIQQFPSVESEQAGEVHYANPTPVKRIVSGTKDPRSKKVEFAEENPPDVLPEFGMVLDLVDAVQQPPLHLSILIDPKATRTPVPFHKNLPWPDTQLDVSYSASNGTIKLVPCKRATANYYSGSTCFSPKIGSSGWVHQSSGSYWTLWVSLDSGAPTYTLRCDIIAL